MYTEPDKVRKHNEEQFIVDFKRTRSFNAHSEKTGSFFRVQKMDVWEFAKQYEIRYTMNIKVYKVDRITMTIL